MQNYIKIYQLDYNKLIFYLFTEQLMPASQCNFT